MAQGLEQSVPRLELTNLHASAYGEHMPPPSLRPLGRLRRVPVAHETGCVDGLHCRKPWPHGVAQTFRVWSPLAPISPEPALPASPVAAPQPGARHADLPSAGSVHDN